MTTQELIAALRSTESRSKAELLKEAADTMEAMQTELHYLMWFSGDGCEICAHKTVEEKTPFRRSCALKGECTPLWHGMKGGNENA